MFRFAKYLDFLHRNLLKKEHNILKTESTPTLRYVGGYLISWLRHTKLF